MDFEKESRNFLDHIRVERGLAENSIAAYKRDLHRLANYLQADGVDLEEVDAKTLQSFHTWLKAEKLSQSSISRILSTMRTFFRYLSREKGIADPTTELEKSKQVRRLPKALTVAEIVSMIEAAYHEGNPISIRDRALLELLYGSGARISEIVNLDLTDVHQLANDGAQIETLKLLGKGGKERIVPLGSFASAALQEYLTRTRPMLALNASKRTNALFLNQRGTRLSRQSAWQFVLNAAKAAGVSGKVSPHVFRHSYATHLLDGGADIRVVQELLGHASVTTTQIYTLITIDKVRETYSLAHPRAR
ncbi:MAG: site-specific tyrosine recombinase XerD [Candidatus Nanopelagicaceae bacterium]|nr:site-specific tyrosine recombinase XerD [Candidatus Nanopelagicaceae bacterium]